MKSIYKLFFLISITALFSCNMEMPHDCSLKVINVGTKNVILAMGTQGNDSVDVKDIIEYYSFLRDNEKRNAVAKYIYNHIIKPKQIDTFCTESWEMNRSLFFVEVDSLDYYLDKHLNMRNFNDYRKQVYNSGTLKTIGWNLKFNYDSLKTY